MKNAKLSAAMKYYELYGVDPDETMILTDEEWANSQGMEESDIVYPEQSDLDACVFTLIEIDNKIAELNEDIEETSEQLRNARNHVAKTEMQNDLSSLGVQIKRLEAEFQIVTAKLEQLRAERSGKKGSR